MLVMVEITVRGGCGGNGIVSFRREKYIPRGGPDGGNGGTGGSVFVKASSKIVDLGLFKQRKRFVAEDGGQGGSRCKHGRKGKDLIVLVPVGTMVLAKANGEERLLADLTAEAGEILVAKGGSGGLGNTRFATAVNQTPEIATEGAPGEERCLVFKLKLLTDICIIGLPNSGKSALLATISQAKPRIADYPFSTREPVLGVIQGDRRDFVVAEIPALVQGAHVGKGLGSEFLCHVERTRVIIYLLEGTSLAVLDDLDTLNRELLLYNSDLLDKAKIVAVNKIDLPEVQARLPQIKQTLSRLDLLAFFVSTVTGYGISELTARAMAMVEEASKIKETALPQVGIFRPKPER